MKFLSDLECTAWLVARHRLEAPYGRPEVTQSAQFPLRPESRLASDLVRVFSHFKVALLQITDWSLYQPDEMAVVSAVRAAHGEHRRLIDAPGHLFSHGEGDLLIGLFTLAAAYHWSAYLYFDHGVTLHNWEGDLLDLWVSEPAQLAAAREVFAAYDPGSSQR